MGGKSSTSSDTTTTNKTSNTSFTRVTDQSDNRQFALQDVGAANLGDGDMNVTNTTTDFGAIEGAGQIARRSLDTADRAGENQVRTTARALDTVDRNVGKSMALVDSGSERAFNFARGAQENANAASGQAIQAIQGTVGNIVGLARGDSGEGADVARVAVIGAVVIGAGFVVLTVFRK